MCWLCTVADFIMWISAHTLSLAVYPLDVKGNGFILIDLLQYELAEFNSTLFLSF